MKGVILSETINKALKTQIETEVKTQIDPLLTDKVIYPYESVKERLVYTA
jgi:hypothetical protein